MLGNREAKRAGNDVSPVFKKACELGNVIMTKRQLKKFNRGVGKAFQFVNAAKIELEKENA